MTLHLIHKNYPIIPPYGSPILPPIIHAKNNIIPHLCQNYFQQSKPISSLIPNINDTPYGLPQINEASHSTKTIKNSENQVTPNFASSSKNLQKTIRKKLDFSSISPLRRILDETNSSGIHTIKSINSFENISQPGSTQTNIINTAKPLSDLTNITMNENSNDLLDKLQENSNNNTSIEKYRKTPLKSNGNISKLKMLLKAYNNDRFYIQNQKNNANKHMINLSNQNVSKNTRKSMSPIRNNIKKSPIPLISLGQKCKQNILNIKCCPKLFKFELKSINLNENYNNSKSRDPSRSKSLPIANSRLSKRNKEENSIKYKKNNKICLKAYGKALQFYNPLPNFNKFR